MTSIPSCSKPAMIRFSDLLIKANGNVIIKKQKIQCIKL